MVSSPTTTSRPNGSRVATAISIPLEKNRKSRRSTARTPRKPHSWAITAKMKSVWAANPLFSRTGEPDEKPTPVTPPEATAASDCRTCHPVAIGSARGHRKPSTRPRCPGVMTKNQSSGEAATPAPAAAPRCRSDAPAAYSITNSAGTNRSVVPRSGCRRIRPVGISAMRTGGMSPVSLRVFLRYIRYRAMANTTAILASSEGCILTPKSENQRRALLRSTPMNSTSTSAISTAA